MKIIIVLAHPNKNSFNHAITYAFSEVLKKNSHQVILHDLYEEKFDPLITSSEISKSGQVDETIAGYCAELKNCGGLVFVHPNWWGQPPAILKGWIDRVLRPGVAYRFNEGDSGEGIPEGLLPDIKAAVINTTDTGYDREMEIFGDPLENIWKKCIFEFCGITRHIRKTFGIMVTSTPEDRKQWLFEAGKLAEDFFPE